MRHREGKVLIDYLKEMIAGEVRKYRPELLDEEIFKALEDGRIKITPARTSNWPFGSPMIPPKVEFKW